MCAYGVLIKEPLLSAYEMLNVHPSLLPRWRGAAPVERAIMAGDEQDRRVDHAVTEGLDSGAVCLQEAEPIRPDDDYGTLAARLERLGGDLLVRALDERPPFVEQDESQVTYAHKIEAARPRARPGRPPDELERTVRALRPHIGARVALPGGDFLGVIAAARRRRRVRARLGARARRPAAARRARRRAGADRDQAAGRSPDGGRRLAPRPPGRAPHRLRRPHAGVAATRRAGRLGGRMMVRRRAERAPRRPERPGRPGRAAAPGRDGGAGAGAGAAGGAGGGGGAGATPGWAAGQGPALPAPRRSARQRPAARARAASRSADRAPAAARPAPGSSAPSRRASRASAPGSSASRTSAPGRRTTGASPLVAVRGRVVIGLRMLGGRRRAGAGARVARLLDRRLGRRGRLIVAVVVGRVLDLDRVGLVPDRVLAVGRRRVGRRVARVGVDRSLRVALGRAGIGAGLLLLGARNAVAVEILAAPVQTPPAFVSGSHGLVLVRTSTALRTPSPSESSSPSLTPSLLVSNSRGDVPVRNSSLLGTPSMSGSELASAPLRRSRP